MVRKVLIFIFTLIMVCTTTLVLYDQANNIKGLVNNDVDRDIKILADVINKGYKKIPAGTLAVLKKDLYFAVWRQYANGEWRPIVVDSKQIPQLKNRENPEIIPSLVKGKVRIYTVKTDELRFKVWVNRKNFSYLAKNILIPFFLLILIYIIILMFIILWFNPTRELIIYDEEIRSYEDEDESDTLEEQMSSPPAGNRTEQKAPEAQQSMNQPEKPDTFTPQTENKAPVSAEKNSDEHVLVFPGENAGQKEVLDEYRKLWGQSFKISDTFKKSFPFDEIYGLIRFRTAPEDYLTNCIIIASEFFMWTNPALFLHQEGRYLNIETKEALDEAALSIPTTGNRMGPVHLPVFAGESEEPLGYFYFEWQNREHFFIADILFVLKQIFSSDARSLFVNQDRNRKKYEEITHYFNQDNNIFIAFMQIDNKQKIRLKVSEEVYDSLNNQIFENLFNQFKKYNVFEIVPFYYGIYGNARDYEKLHNEVSSFCADEELHNYEISKQYGNIAVSLSGGVTKVSARNSDLSRIISNAEDNLTMALKQGGDQVIFD